MAPAESIDVVPVPPMASVLAEKSVDEAPAKKKSGVDVDTPSSNKVHEKLPEPPESSSVPQMRFPDESVCRSELDAEQSSVAMLRPLPSMTRPLIVDVAAVASMLVTCIPAAKVDDAAVPCTTRNPVVVAPPKIVSPVACPPAPMVEDAAESMPVRVARPLVVSVVTPVIAPLVTSHESLAMSILSPPSPIVRVAVVVSVPDIELEPITPPEIVRASLT